MHTDAWVHRHRKAEISLAVLMLMEWLQHPGSSACSLLYAVNRSWGCYMQGDRVCCIPLNKEAGIATLSMSSLYRGAVFRL